MTSAALGVAIALSFTSFGSAPKPEGFLAEPASKKGPGVLVLHAWWGLNSDIKALCNRLAKSGFVAFAPDLFNGKTASTPEAARELTKEHQSKDAEIKAHLLESANYLAERTGKKQIAVLGLSFGAYYALEFSNTEPALVKSVVVFYGTGHEDFAKSKASYLGHFAETDDFEPKEGVDHLATLLREAGRPATIHTYPATGHWFFEPSVKSAYDKKAAELAWKRTLEFLKKN